MPFRPGNRRVAKSLGIIWGKILRKCEIWMCFNPMGWKLALDAAFSGAGSD